MVPMRALFAVLMFAVTIPLGWSAEQSRAPQWRVYFSPHGGCTEAVVAALKAARSTIHVQAYSFTSVPIAQALIDAHRRGVKVHVVLDKSQRGEKYTSATMLKNAGVDCAIDAKHSIAHNKVMVIDGTTVITGSFNFSMAAEKSNAENLLVIPDAELAKKYMSNWEMHRQHSEVYEGLGSKAR